MRATATVASLSLVLAGAALCAACSAPPPADPAPTSTSPSAARPSGTSATARPEVRLPGGVALPEGVALVGAAPQEVRRGRYEEWHATVRLGSATEAAVLDAVGRSVSSLGWTVTRGLHDTFATRCSPVRCELLIVRTAPPSSPTTTAPEMVVMYASRPA